MLVVGISLSPAAVAEESVSVGASAQQVIAAAGEQYQALSDANKPNQSNLVLFVKFFG